MNITMLAQKDEMREGALRISGSDAPNHVYYSDNAGGSLLLRVHFRIARLSGSAGYTLAHFADATIEDRARAKERASRIGDLGVLFSRCKAAGVMYRRRYPEDRRRWVEYVMLGTPVSDPLIQLELEMMIDQTTPAVVNPRLVTR